MNANISVAANGFFRYPVFVNDENFLLNRV